MPQSILRGVAQLGCALSKHHGVVFVVDTHESAARSAECWWVPARCIAPRGRGGADRPKTDRTFAVGVGKGERRRGRYQLLSGRL